MLIKSEISIHIAFPLSSQLIIIYIIPKSFFEELEDMKYALQQSIQLNQEYERALKRICKQTGLNYKRALHQQQDDKRHSTPNSNGRNSTGKRKKRQSNVSS